MNLFRSYQRLWRESRLIGRSTPEAPGYEQFNTPESEPARIQNVEEFRRHAMRQGNEKAKKLLEDLEARGYDTRTDSQRKQDRGRMSLSDLERATDVPETKYHDGYVHRLGMTYRNGETRYVIRRYKPGFDPERARQRRAAYMRHLRSTPEGKMKLRGAKDRYLLTGEKAVPDEFRAQGAYDEEFYIGEADLASHQTADERREAGERLQQERHQAKLARRRETFSRDPGAFRNWSRASKREFLGLGEPDATDVPGTTGQSDRGPSGPSQEALDRWEDFYRRAGFPGGTDQAYAVFEVEKKYGRGLHRIDEHGNVTVHWQNGRMAKFTPDGRLMSEAERSGEADRLPKGPLGREIPSIMDIKAPLRGHLMSVVDSGLNISFRDLKDFDEKVTITEVSPADESKGKPQVLAVSTEPYTLNGRVVEGRTVYVTLNEVSVPGSKPQFGADVVPKDAITPSGLENMLDSFVGHEDFYSELLAPDQAKLLAHISSLPTSQKEAFALAKAGDLIRLRALFNEYNPLIDHLAQQSEPLTLVKLKKLAETNPAAIAVLVKKNIDSTPNMRRRAQWSTFLSEALGDEWWRDGGVEEELSKILPPPLPADVGASGLFTMNQVPNALPPNTPVIANAPATTPAAAAPEMPTEALPENLSGIEQLLRRNLKLSDAQFLASVRLIEQATEAAKGEDAVQRITTIEQLQSLILQIKPRLQTHIDNKSTLLPLAARLEKAKQVLDGLDKDTKGFELWTQKIVFKWAELFRGITGLDPLQITQKTTFIDRKPEEVLDENAPLDTLDESKVRIEQLPVFIKRLEAAGEARTPALTTVLNKLYALRTRAEIVRNTWKEISRRKESDFISSVELVGTGDRLELTLKKPSVIDTVKRAVLGQGSIMELMPRDETAKLTISIKADRPLSANEIRLLLERIYNESQTAK